MRKRNCRVWVRLNKDEYEALQKKVRKTKLSQEGYIRLLLNDVTPKETPPVEYHSFIRELRAIGNSLNQIARRANAGGFIEAPHYRSEVEKLHKAILEIRQAVTNPEGGD